MLDSNIFDRAKRIINAPEGPEAREVMEGAQRAEKVTQSGVMERIETVSDDARKALSLHLINAAANLIAVDEGRSTDEDWNLSNLDKERMKLKIDQIKKEFMSGWIVDGSRATKLLHGHAKASPFLEDAITAIIRSYMKPERYKEWGNSYGIFEGEFRVPSPFLERVQTQIKQHVRA